MLTTNSARSLKSLQIPRKLKNLSSTEWYFQKMKKIGTNTIRFGHFSIRFKTWNICTTSKYSLATECCLMGQASNTHKLSRKSNWKWKEIREILKKIRKKEQRLQNLNKKKVRKLLYPNWTKPKRSSWMRYKLNKSRQIYNDNIFNMIFIN